MIYFLITGVIKMRKCVRCSKKFEDTVEYKGKRYCNECFSEYINLKASCSVCKISFTRNLEFTSDEMESKDKKKTFCSATCYEKLIQERQDLDELDNWLKQYHKTDKLNNRVYMQINQFKSKNNFTYKGMLLTLEYITGTLKKKIQLDTVGIIAWYYDNARDEYVKKAKRKEKNESLSDFIMFQNSEYSPTVAKQVDNRRDKILITSIDFN